MIGRFRLKLGSTGINGFEHRKNTEVLAALSHVVFRDAHKERDLHVAKTIALKLVYACARYMRKGFHACTHIGEKLRCFINDLFALGDEPWIVFGDRVDLINRHAEAEGIAQIIHGAGCTLSKSDVQGGKCLSILRDILKVAMQIKTESMSLLLERAKTFL